MPKIGGLETRKSKKGRVWEHPEFPDSYFVQLTATTGSDAVWNDEPQPVDFDDEVFEEAMEELDVEQLAAESGDERNGVETEHGWFSVDPRELDLYALVGVSNRNPFGTPELMLFERRER